MQKKVFIALWGLFAIFLFLYSFTQVDLSLTLSRASMYQNIEKGFQYIGYFNRPLSTYLYIALGMVGALLYFVTLQKVRKKAIDRKTVWIAIGVISIILLFSYNAFSYDLFNYIFDAKIITHYQQNPYIHKALDFPNDPMLSFMRWTHRTYPYGPVWLALTVPFSYLGLGYFIVTFFLFKTFMVGAFLVTCYGIEKIAQKTKHIDPLFALAFFAFNPLVIVESINSSHLDIVMMALGVFALYYFLTRKKAISGVLLLLSIGVKFATVFLTPVLLYFSLKSSKKQNEQIFIWSTILMTLSVIAASLRTTFQPWYLLDVLPFAALASDRDYIFYPISIISVFALLQYVPYLYLGNWNPPVPTILLDLTVISILISVLYILLIRYGKKKSSV